MTSGPGVALIGGRHIFYPYGKVNGRVQRHLNPFRRDLQIC
jgi:hypothetical protein